MQLPEPQTGDKAAVCTAAQHYSRAKSSAGTANTATILPGGNLHSVGFFFLRLCFGFLSEEQSSQFTISTLTGSTQGLQTFISKRRTWDFLDWGFWSSLMSGVWLTLLFHIQTSYQSPPPTTKTPVHSCHVLLMTRLQCVAKEM